MMRTRASLLHLMRFVLFLLGWLASGATTATAHVTAVRKCKDCPGCRMRGGGSPLFDTDYARRRQRQQRLQDEGFTRWYGRWERIEQEGEANEAKKKQGSICGFYVWNFPSALLHRWCHFMLKDCTYEGRGGVKFARIAPRSTLDFLWPCSRYSTDSCMICGGGYQDHLALSWRKHLNSPINEWLERTLREGSVQVPMDENENGFRNPRPRPAGKSARKMKRPPPATKSNYVFHRLYVSERPPDAKSKRKQTNTKQQQRQKAPDKRTQRKKKVTSKPELEWRDSAVYPGSQSVVYGVPAFTRRERTARPMALSLAWFIVLDTLDDLISIETMENNLKKKRNN